MSGICPTCGQAVLMRHGVKLPPQKAAILALVEEASKGRDGIKIAVLASVFYPEVPTSVAYARLRVHISQLNSLLASTDYRVVTRSGLFRFEGAP
jgi:hypothetical protein